MKNQFDIDSLREYAEKGLITGREHPDLELVVWNYTAETQYGRLWDETTLATRGLVTDMQGRTVAPCIPKFFNLAEPENDGVAIDDFDYAQEKLDGSLIHVFWYDNQWVCSSRGSFESDHAGWAQELVEKNANMLHRWSTPGVVFVCELIVPENRIVVDYGDEESLRLITTFTNLAGEWREYPAAGYDWPWSKVREFNLKTARNYLEQSGIEGVVLLDRDHNRAKIKTDEYVEHHRIVTGLTTKNVLEHYMEHGSVDKLLEVAPDEWYERIGDLAWSFDSAVGLVGTMIRAQYRNVLESLGKDFTRKDFAMIVKGQQNAPFLFALLDGKDIYPMVQRKVFDDRDRYKDLEL